MNPEVKRQWVEALLSGEYKQGTGALRSRNTVGGTETHCCLDVLSDLAVKAGALAAPVLDGHNHYVYGTSEESCYLPPEVSDWAELEDPNPWIPAMESSIADLNDADDDESTFVDLATLIKEQL